MIAEISGKISSKGTNLSDRLEDNLTGDVFGALRYIPYSEGFEKILKKRRVVTPTRFSDDMLRIDQDQLDKYDAYIEFWPRDKDSELDVIITTSRLIIGIEVKYRSGISSDDLIDKKPEDSNHQLIREMRSLISRSGEHKKAALIFVAPEPESREVVSKLVDERRVHQNVELSYLSWETILDILDEIRLDDDRLQVILDDICSLLSKKDFSRFLKFETGPKVEDELYFKIDKGE